MPRSPLRLGVAALALAAAIGGTGLLWELLYFGTTPAATIERLEADVRQRVLARSRQVEWLATQVAQRGALVERAAAEPEPAPALFEALSALSRQTYPTNSRSTSATVYVPVGPARGFRVLAWSDGPAEDVPADRLAGPAQLFVAQGTLGPLLTYVHPIEHEGRRVGVAAAQTALSRPAGVGGAGAGLFESAYGPVAITQVFSDGTAATRPSGFVIESDGRLLLEVQFDRSSLDARRLRIRVVVMTLAALPLVGLLVAATARVLERRTRANRGWPQDLWSLAAAGLVVVAGLALVLLARLAEAPDGVVATVTGCAALALTVLFPLSWWWRPGSRLVPRARLLPFALEQLAGGVVLAVALVIATRFAAAHVLPESLALWPTPALATDPGGVLGAVGLLLAELALCWAAAGLLAWSASRWRVSWRNPGTGLAAMSLWLLPTAFLLGAQISPQPLPVGGLGTTAVAIATFGLFSSAFRRYYRRTTQAMRLVLLFAAMVLPPAALYPVTAFTADRQARATVERDYAPATQTLPDRLQAALSEAQREVDGVPGLADMVATAPTAGPTAQSRLAYLVWSATVLSRTRVTSEVELYDPAGALVSRFGLNVPEYGGAVADETLRTRSCSWQVFSEVRRFGADDRLMWHAERAICDADGLKGALVIHALPDYEALPFISSADPYRAALSASNQPSGPAPLDGLSVVIYGWGRTPLFASGDAAWPLPEDVFQRLRANRASFWTEIAARGRAYKVYFTNDRSFVYAFGYPRPSWFAHAARIAEIAAIMAALFVALLVAASLFAPLRDRREAPLRVLFNEVRTSFYRKLYLFFVLAAIGPVVLLSLAFGAYISARTQAGVESEAMHVVTVARRVFQELAAAQAAPAQPQAPPSDDVMVWIRQVINQDVNLFRSSRLVATSQRDLFDSGLLPTRTPATIYRAVAMDRLPSFVGRDRIGAFDYLIAAAPIPAAGPDTVLSVPLALQQREIERELEDVNRGVLVAGAVVVLFAAGLGASVAGRVSDPVARLTRATRQIAAGRLDVRIVADTADELKRLVDDFNAMTETLVAQRAALARTNQLAAWAEMARQVAHEIKNPLTPIQLATEHLERVHTDHGRPLGAVFDQCVTTIYRQVRLLRQIASEFSNFAGTPTPRFEAVSLGALLSDVAGAYRSSDVVRLSVSVPADLPDVWVDRTLISRAVTNVVENAVQAMPAGGSIEVVARAEGDQVAIVVSDTGVGMDDEAASRAFEPYFSTKTAGSGLGLPNAKRNIELCGGTIGLDSARGRGTRVTIRLPAVPPSS